MTTRKPILADSGYTGIQNTFPEALISKKKPKRSTLSNDDKRFNRHLSHDRIIVENYFARLKVKFGILDCKFRSEIRILKDLIPILVALTNYHVDIHPLL